MAQNVFERKSFLFSPLQNVQGGYAFYWLKNKAAVIVNQLHMNAPKKELFTENPELTLYLLGKIK